jgi:hypothetical protein
MIRLVWKQHFASKSRTVQRLPFLPWDFPKQKKFFVKQWQWALTRESL